MPLPKTVKPVLNYYVVESENNRNNNWSNNTVVYCKDTGKTYILINNSWNLLSSGQPPSTVNLSYDNILGNFSSIVS